MQRSSTCMYYTDVDFAFFLLPYLFPLSYTTCYPRHPSSSSYPSIRGVLQSLADELLADLDDLEDDDQDNLLVRSPKNSTDARTDGIRTELL